MNLCFIAAAPDYGHKKTHRFAETLRWVSCFLGTGREAILLFCGMLRQNLLNFFFFGHRPDGTLLCGDQVCGSIGEAEHFSELLFGQLFYTVFQHKAQHTGTEGIACAGGFDGAAQLEARDENLVAAAVRIAAVGTGGDVQNLDVGITFLQDSCALIKIGFAGHELDLIVCDL